MITVDATGASDITAVCAVAHAGDGLVDLADPTGHTLARITQTSAQTLMDQLADILARPTPGRPRRAAVAFRRVRSR